jgi:Flp pilus assembly protein TadG
MMKALNQRTRWRLHSASRGIEPGIENRERGSTVVEFAICAVLLFTVLFGIMDFSRALYTYHFLSNSAREATRYAIVRGSACNSIVPGCPVTTNLEIQNYVQQTLATPSAGLLNQDGITTTTTWTACASCTTKYDPGSTVQVQLTYTFQFILPFLPKSGITMQSTSQMVISQ